MTGSSPSSRPMRAWPALFPPGDRATAQRLRTATVRVTGMLVRSNQAGLSRQIPCRHGYHTRCKSDVLSRRQCIS